MKTTFLVISLILSLGSAVPYIRDILRRKTKPSIVTWSTWAVLTAIATAAEFSAGEYFTALFTLASTIGNLTIVILGLRYGHSKYRPLDLICQVSVVIGIGLWIFLHDPLLAVLTMIVVDFIGALPTFSHIWKRPREETLLTYEMGVASAACILVALKSHAPIALAFPLYLILLNGLFAASIITRRARRKRRA